MSLQFTMHHDLLCDGDLYGTITCDTAFAVTGTLAVTGAATFSSTITCDSITFSGTQTFEGGMVVNDLGAAVDFRVEGDTLPNLLAVDASADRVFICDDATGGTFPDGTYGAGTLLVISSDSAAGDNAIMALTSGATGAAEIHFGLTGNPDEGIISYSSANDLFTVTAGTTATMTVGAATVAMQAAVTVNEDGSDVDFRVEGDTLPNLLAVDASADRVFISDDATGGTFPDGTYGAGTLLVVSSDSAAGDNAIIALTSGATGAGEIHFGLTGDPDEGIISYSSANDLFTVTAGTTAVATIGAAAVAMEAAVTINDAGADYDFRVEGDNLPNLLAVDASADRVFICDDAVGGTFPDGSYEAGTLLVISNDSAGGDDAILALTADATSGLAQIHFGDTADPNEGIISYDNATSAFTITGGVTGSTITTTGIADLDQIVSGTAAMALGNGANDDVTNPGASVALISGPTGAFSISGIAGGTDGQVLIIINNVAQNLTLTNEGGGSAAANRILTGTGGDVATTAQGACILVYNGTSSRWHLCSAVAA